MAISGLTSAIGGGSLQAAQSAQEASSTANQVAQIGAQMKSEKDKTAAQIRQIKMETQTKVAEMFRESILNRAKSASKIHGKWVQQMML